MPNSRRPGPAPRQRVAGLRKRSGSKDQDRTSRLGLSRREGTDGPAESSTEDSSPAESTAAESPAAEEQVSGTESGTEEPKEDAAQATRASGDEDETRAVASQADSEEADEYGAQAVASPESDVEADSEQEPSAAHPESETETSRADSAPAEARSGPVSSGKADRRARKASEAAAADPDQSTTRSELAPGPLTWGTATESQDAEEPEPASAAERTKPPLVTAGFVGAAVLAAMAIWFGAQAHALRTGPAANDALVDQATTSEVNGQMSEAVKQIFSYDFADTAKTENAAKNVLVGGAVDEYNQLFTTVKQQAPAQKLVVTTTVKASSVVRLDGDRAEVLLFVDQNATRTDNGQNTVGPAQVVVSAEKHGDQWKINHITQH